MAKAKKLPSGSWRVQAYATVDGKKLKKSITATDKKSAEILALNWQQSITESFSSDPKLKDAYERYIASKEKVLSPATVRLYKQMSHNTFQTLMNTNIREISTEQVQKEINLYAANRSPKSVKNAYGLFTAVCSMFCPERKFNVKLPQKKKAEFYIPNDDDIKTLLDNTDGDLKLAIMLGAFAGLRRGEICALTNKDIGQGYINISKSLSITENGNYVEKSPKSYSGYRKVDIPQFLYDAIKNIDGKIIKIHPNTICNQFNLLLHGLDIEHFRFHDLRHYYVSHCFDIGLPEKYIIAQVGHSSSAITKAVYDHIQQNKMSEYSKKISNSFNDFIA